MNDYYQLLTEKNAREDSLAIVAILQSIHDGRLVNDLRLLNFFREIPVSYPASIEYVEADMVDLSVHQHQAVVMKFEHKTIVKSRHFPHEVMANVFRANIGSSMVTLTNFAYASVRAERRRYVRVAVKDSLSVVFTNGDREVRGNMVDISLCGIALVGRMDNTFDTQNEGALILTISGKTISIPAKLVKIIPVEGESRYVFDFEVSSKDEALISQYIFQRQVEIIKELKDQIA